MTPKEKAIELFDEYSNIETMEFDVNGKYSPSFIGYTVGKTIAIKTVKQIIKEINSIPKYATCNKFESKKYFWDNVLVELQNL